MSTAQKTKPRTETAAKKPSPKKLGERRDQLAADAKDLSRAAQSLKAKRVPNSEQIFKNEYDRMLRYNSSLIRRMNEQLRTQLSSRDIYALSTIMSQQREVINDLRSIADMSQQVGMLYDQAVTPFVSDMTQLVTDVYYQLRRLLMETSKPKETQFALAQLDDLIKQLGLGMQTGQGVMRQSISQVLLGPTDTVKVKKKQR